MKKVLCIAALLCFTVPAAAEPAQPPICGNPRLTVTVVGTEAVAVPTTIAAGRRWIDICVSVENTGSPIVKCRADGVAPVMGATEPGDALMKGECIRYVRPTTAIRCIANTAGVAVAATECGKVVN